MASQCVGSARQPDRAQQPQPAGASAPAAARRYLLLQVVPDAAVQGGELPQLLRVNLLASIGQGGKNSSGVGAGGRASHGPASGLQKTQAAGPAAPAAAARTRPGRQRGVAPCPAAECRWDDRRASHRRMLRQGARQGDGGGLVGCVVTHRAAPAARDVNRVHGAAAARRSLTAALVRPGAPSLLASQAGSPYSQRALAGGSLRALMRVLSQGGRRGAPALTLGVPLGKVAPLMEAEVGEDCGFCEAGWKAGRLSCFIESESIDLATGRCWRRHPRAGSRQRAAGSPNPRPATHPCPPPSPCAT